MALAFVERF